MKHIAKIVLLFCVFSCKVSYQDGVYDSRHILYGRVALRLALKKDATFKYYFVYSPIIVEGRWTVIADTLILTSPTFREQDTTLYKIKNSNMFDRDIYVKKGKKLFLIDSAINRSGISPLILR